LRWTLWPVREKPPNAMFAMANVRCSVASVTGAGAAMFVLRSAETLSEYVNGAPAFDPTRMPPVVVGCGVSSRSSTRVPCLRVMMLTSPMNAKSP
jgi:hypothetical protein